MAATKQHPSFPHPAIQEAICEVHFQVAQDGWKPTTFGDYFKQLQPEFPEFEPVAEIGVQVQVGPAGMGQELIPPQQRVRYRHKERAVLIQLSSSVLVLNVLPVYSGWKEMQKDLLSSWQKLSAIVPVEDVRRIGLRYINRMPKSDGETVGEWLAASDFIPAAALSSSHGLLSRLEIHPSATDRRIVTVADVKADSADSTGLFFDIDCIDEKLSKASQPSIKDRLVRLHDEAWRIFCASITPRLDDYLQAEEQ